MLTISSGIDYLHNHCLEDKYSASDVQFALQLLYVVFGIDPSKIDLMQTLVELNAQPHLLSRFARGGKVKLLQYVMSLWANEVGLENHNCQIYTVLDLFKIILCWRKTIKLGEKAWHDTSYENIMELLTQKVELSVSKKQSEIVCIMNTNKVIDISLIAHCLNSSILRNICTIGFSAFYLLLICAREWLDCKDFCNRFYPELQIDNRVISIIFDSIHGELQSVIPTQLIRPQDGLQYDDYLWIISCNITNKLIAEGFHVNEGSSVITRDASKDSLLSYDSVHSLILLIIDNVKCRN